jgi:WD40 repeat-containing protein SMU1
MDVSGKIAGAPANCRLPMPVEVEASDVIRLILQFLGEHGLTKSMATLQAETGTGLQTVSDPAGLVAAIHGGSWERVLEMLRPASLDPTLLIALYEQLFLELAEEGHIDAARILLRESEPMGVLRQDDEQRYLKLENALSTAILSKTAGAKIDLVQRKEAKRAKIAKDLLGHLTAVPPGRLLALLGEALQWEAQGQSSEAVSFDIFRGIVPMMTAKTDAIPSTCYKTAKLPAGEHVEAAAFSPDGALFVVGLADGFIEVWSLASGLPRLDLAYQSSPASKADFMVMRTSIMCMAFTPDSALLAVGCLDGSVALWKVATGQCLKRIPEAHTGGVFSVAFSPDGTSILTAGYDNAARLFSSRTGTLIRQFAGHTACVQDARWAVEGTRVLTASADGSVKCWNPASGECLATVWPTDDQEDPGSLMTKAVKSLSPVQGHPNAFLIASQHPFLRVVGPTGKLGKAFTGKSLPSFATACSSPSGKFVYGLGEDREVYCFEYATGSLERQFTASAYEVIGAVHHPQLNVMVTFDTEGNVSFWKSA